jgi:hypothetical protein
VWPPVAGYMSTAIRAASKVRFRHGQATCEDDPERKSSDAETAPLVHARIIPIWYEAPSSSVYDRM